MDDEEDVVNHRHCVCSPDVQEIDKHNDGKDKQCALPVRRAIGGIIDHQNALDECAHQERTRGLAGLPR